MFDYLPTAPLENLRKRAQIIQRIRHFFDSLGFVEVQTPVLSHDTVVDAFVEPIMVSGLLGMKDVTPFYLQTSPEFAMKRLISAGMSAIYQITPAFRRGDRGPLHNVEFTMLEWYRVGDDYRQGRDFLKNFIQNFYSGNSVEESPFGDIFEKYVGLNPHRCSVDELRDWAITHAVDFPDSYLSDGCPASKNDWIDLIFSEKVQPDLGVTTPILLYDYPAEQSQLSKTRRVVDSFSGKSWRVSERFELFIEGQELANGYHELCDSAILRDRIQSVQEIRRANHLPELPSESRLLEAMDIGFPPCSGCALGVDRLLMILMKARKIDDVLAFPIERA